MRLRFSILLFLFYHTAAGLDAQINSLLNNPEERGTHAYELEMFEEAATYFDSLQTNNHLLEDSSLVNYLYGVTDRLLPGQRKLTPWKIYVEKDLTPNAGAFPDGRLLITTGLLLRFDSEAQLAFVLGHELAHYLYRHSLRQRVVAEESNTFLKSRLALKNAKFSREMEWDADAIALILYARAGYPDGQAAEALRRLPAELNYEWMFKVFSFGRPRDSPYRTHPRTPERIEKIIALSAETDFENALEVDGYNAATKEVNLASRKRMIVGMNRFTSRATKARQIDSLFAQMSEEENKTAFFWEMKLIQAEARLNLVCLPVSAASREMQVDLNKVSYEGQSNDQEEEVYAISLFSDKEAYNENIAVVKTKLMENIVDIRRHTQIAYEADRLEGILLYEAGKHSTALPILQRYLDHESAVIQKRYIRHLVSEIREQAKSPKKKNRRKRN